MRFTLMIIIFSAMFLHGCNDLSSQNKQDQDFKQMEMKKEFELNEEENIKDALSSSGFSEEHAGIEEVNGKLLDQEEDASNWQKNDRSANIVGQNSISEDQEMIEGIIYDLPNVEPGTVIIVGDFAWVNIMFEDNPTEEERERLVLEIEKRLHEAKPNYKYQIVVNDFMHTESAL